MPNLASDSLTLRVQAEQIANTYLDTGPHIGAPSSLGDPDVLQLLLAAIGDGVDYERACKTAGIAPRTIYNWKTRAEHGDETAIRFVQALEKAEAEVERRVTRNVLKASDMPQYWAAGMTYLERRYPERYGRRDDSGVTAKVQVSIGDVSISAELKGLRGEGDLSPATFAVDLGRNPDANSLTSNACASPSRLIIGDYVNPSGSVPAGEIAAGRQAIEIPAHGLAGVPPGQGEAPLAGQAGVPVKRVGGGKKEKRAKR